MMRKWVFLAVAPLLICCLISANHTGPKHCVKTYCALDDFANQFAKEHQLEFLNSGVGSLADAHKGIWAIHLVSRQQLTIDQGRQLATTLASQLLRKVFTDPVFAYYCQKEHNAAQPKIDQVAFRLAFWTKDQNRPQHPFLAQIRLADGNLYYHYADPTTQALQTPIVESFDLPVFTVDR